jgi:hypothetical protein
MIKRSILSTLAGVVFAAFLFFATPVKASCLGFCENNVGNYYYVGCTMELWGNQLHITCYYTEAAGPLLAPNIAD